MALFGRPANERVILAQIQDVVLVDPRRDDEQRPLADGLGGRRVLDQFHQGVPEHHLARGDGDVAPDIEGVRVRHADVEPTFAPLQVVKQVLDPPDQVLAAAVDGGAQDLGVGHGEVAGR